jgi:hypothetical protein
MSYIGFHLYILRLQIPSPFGEFTPGLLTSTSILTLFFLIPVVIPILTDNKLFRWIVFFLGILITIINVGVVGFTYLLDNVGTEPIIWVIVMIVICGFTGSFGVYFTYKWIKQLN